MLHKTIPMAVPYAKALAEQGIRVAVPLNSDLGILMQHSVQDNPMATVPVSGFIQGVENAVMVTGQISDYEGYRESLIQELRGPVLQHIRMSQDIRGLAMSLSENVRNFAKNAQDSSATEKFMIVKDRLGDVFCIDQINATFQTKFALAGGIPNVSLVTGVRTRDQILALISSTGNEKMDNAITQMVEQFDDYQWLENIYYAFINTSTGFDTGFDVRYMDAVPVGERASVYLVAALIATNLVDKVPEDAVGNLNTFRGNAATVRDYCFNRAGAAVEEYGALVARNVLVSGTKKINDCVCVCVVEDVYSKWLDNGGRPEILMAVALSNKKIQTVEEIGNQTDALVTVWNNYCAIHRSHESIRAALILRSLYIQSFVESVSMVQPYEEEYRKNNPRHAETCIDGAQKWLEKISVDALNNFDEVALELVGRYRFPYLPAYEILKEINQIRKDSDDIPVREAALVASTKYMVRYLVTQMSISRTQ